jgi:signal peptidase I
MSASNTTIPTLSIASSTRGVALRALWFVLIPLLVTAVTWRYLVPCPNAAGGGALRGLAEFCDQHQTLAWPALFLFFSYVIRYWRAHLPGARYWSEAPPSAASSARGTALWFAAVLLAAGSALVVRSSLFQTYRVLSSSMLPNLRPDDLLLASRFAYGFKWIGSRTASAKPPARGDVIVFHHQLGPQYPDELVKRVVGLPGDLIHMYGGHPFINGWRVPDCDVGRYTYVAGDGMLEGALRMEFLGDKTYLTVHGAWDQKPQPDYVVQPGEAFVLGDNRNNSSDSRAWNGGKGGGLPFQEIRGRVDRYLFPVHRNGEVDTARVLSRLSPQLFMDGVDVGPLRQGIERCLRERPKDTLPPPPKVKK